MPCLQQRKVTQPPHQQLVRKTMRRRANTYQDTTPDTGRQPEDMDFAQPYDDEELRRGGPNKQPYQFNTDWYAYADEDQLEDSSPSNRYDNDIRLVSSLKLVSSQDPSFDYDTTRNNWLWEYEPTAPALDNSTDRQIYDSDKNPDVGEQNWEHDIREDLEHMDEEDRRNLQLWTAGLDWYNVLVKKGVG